MSDELAIVGSRGFNGTDDYVGLVLDDFTCEDDTLVSGGALNVDRAAEKEAQRRGMFVVSYRPRKTVTGFVIDRYENGERVDTESDGEAPLLFDSFAEAAKQRNWLIAGRTRGHFHALWDGMSGGTAHSIAAALRLSHGKPPRIWMEGDKGRDK